MLSSGERRVPTHARDHPLAPADLLPSYRQAALEREELGVPALPLNAAQASALTALLEQPPAGDEGFLLHLLSERIPPGWMRRPT